MKPGAGHETWARQSVRFVSRFTPTADEFGKQTWRRELSIVGLGA